jgi:hypothetical protein
MLIATPLFPASIAPILPLQAGSRGREPRERAIVGNESRTTSHVGVKPEFTALAAIYLPGGGVARGMP